MQLKSQLKSPLVQLIFQKAIQLGFKSQKELATAAEISESVISRLASGRMASTENLYALLKRLDLLKHHSENPKNGPPQQGPSEELLLAYKELSQSRKELAEHKDRIRELEHAMAELQFRNKSECRRDDPAGFNPSKLRRPLQPAH
jgi:transcriptional regulator with XRE-family HTH domain